MQYTFSNWTSLHFNSSHLGLIRLPDFMQARTKFHRSPSPEWGITRFPVVCAGSHLMWGRTHPLDPPSSSSSWSLLCTTALEWHQPPWWEGSEMIMHGMMTWPSSTTCTQTRSFALLNYCHLNFSSLTERGDVLGGGVLVPGWLQGFHKKLHLLLCQMSEVLK